MCDLLKCSVVVVCFIWYFFKPKYKVKIYLFKTELTIIKRNKFSSAFVLLVNTKLLVKMRKYCSGTFDIQVTKRGPRWVKKKAEIAYKNQFIYLQ